MESLYDRKVLRAFLERHGIWARKGMAQHFLCSKGAVDAICDRVTGFNGMLEIGPGPGVLTSRLSECAKKMIALEIDERMIEALRESAPKAEVRLADVLESDLHEILEELPARRAVVSNMPYHITGPLLTKIAQARRSFGKAMLMMQKEVADRILAEAGNSNRGSLSVFLQAQFDIGMVYKVPAGSFLPAPKVDSAVLEFVPRETGLKPAEEEGFFKFTRSGFQQPRKTLANNLAAAFGRDQASSAIGRTGLAPNVRPHMLNLEGWMLLWKSMENLRE